jgi:hypothetical protein
MANLYYSQPVNRHGALRVVLSADEARCLLSGHSAQYVGQEFPTKGQEPGVEFALLRLFEEGANENGAPVLPIRGRPHADGRSRPSLHCGTGGV